MKRIVSVILCAVCLPAVVPLVSAQDCSTWSNWDLRGTYTMAGSGWMDLSKVLPGMGLPSGLVQMSWVGAHVFNGAGGGAGWASINAAGSQMNAQFVGLKYSVSSDCSVQISWSLKIKELGITIGPFARFGVIVWTPQALEIHSLLMGAPLGTPSSGGLDLGVSHRISSQSY
jgi:hypothetical protein